MKASHGPWDNFAFIFLLCKQIVLHVSKVLLLDNSQPGGPQRAE